MMDRDIDNYLKSFVQLLITKEHFPNASNFLAHTSQFIIMVSKAVQWFQPIKIISRGGTKNFSIVGKFSEGELQYGYQGIRIATLTP